MSNIFGYRLHFNFLVLLRCIFNVVHFTHYGETSAMMTLWSLYIGQNAYTKLIMETAAAGVKQTPLHHAAPTP